MIHELKKTTAITLTVSSPKKNSEMRH